MIEINSKEEILDILKNSKAVMLYFGATNCSVCQVLRPKVEMNISLNFSKMKQYYINSNQNLDITSHFNIFQVQLFWSFLKVKSLKDMVEILV